ncbi:MAG: hypothetical protein Q8J69_08270 [Sphingobacteriaceae bacterium]|nr:hypothetical protein [Sphingobacteriaceae bacterium]
MNRSSVHNIRQVLLFRGVAFGIVGLGTLALFSDIDEITRMALFIGSLVVLISFWLMVQPGYLAFETAQGKILISTDKEDKSEFFLIMPANELAGYEIEKSHAGLRRKLFLYRKTPKGFMKSKAIPMSLFTAHQTLQMCAQLDAMVAANGFGHLKL